MNRSIEMIFDVIAEFVKFMFMLLIFIVALQYLNLYIAADRILYEAELEGGFKDTSIEKWLTKLKIENSQITKCETEPLRGTKVNQLGDIMAIELVQTIRVKTLGEGFDFDITVVKKGINHGYYGTEGYGDYTLED